jgi:catechol 2,3-dioxygenase-like lactoylglutathione lyase family enzyme
MSLIQANTLSHFAVRVRDVAASTKWYEDILGLEVFMDQRTDPNMPRVFGMLGGVALELYRAPDADEVKGSAVISFSVENIEAAHAALRSKGLGSEQLMTFGDARLVLFRDPDGNVLEVIQLGRGAKSMADIGGKVLAKRRATAAPAASS